MPSGYMDANGYYHDPQGNTWAVPPGYTPETSPYNPANASQYGRPQSNTTVDNGWGMGYDWTQDPSTYAPPPPQLTQAGAPQSLGGMPQNQTADSIPIGGGDPTELYRDPYEPPAGQQPANGAPANGAPPEDYGVPAMNPPAGGGTVNTNPASMGQPGTGTPMSPEDQQYWDMFGMTDIPDLEEYQLPENPQLQGNYSQQFQTDYNQNFGNAANQIGGYYDQGNWGQANAAGMDINGIPRTNAQTPEGFDQLDFLLSGQGFDPATMAKLRATATDDISAAGRSNRGSARLMAEQSGIAGSPAAMALEQQANRNQGAAQTRALNQLDIENAGRGLENLRMGSQMELGRRTNSAEMVNQAALANAARIFSGMQQNTSNQQQANMTNAGFGQERNMARAGAQSGLTANAASQFGNAALQRNAQADVGNVNNTINRNLNQAQITQQARQFNIGNQYGNQQNASGNLVSLINGTNPATYNTNAAQIGSNSQPNLIGANTVANIGQIPLNQQRT